MSGALDELAELVRRESGITLSERQHPTLRAALRRAAPGMGPAAFLRVAADPAQRGGALERLLDEVTVQETFFLRERAQLESLRWHDLAEAARARGDPAVRVWVAACATGEEAYTLAILAREAFAPLEPPVTILATDISAGALERARHGVYRERAVRELDAGRRARWLHADAARFTVNEDVRRLVHFRKHNLVAEPAPPPGETAFDVIACRNVLIYFDAATADAVRESLECALLPGGRLLLGTADALGAHARRRVVPVVARAPAAPASRTALAPARRGSAVAPARGRRPARAPTRDERLARALAAAGAGRHDEALEDVQALLRRDPFDADAHFLQGLVELGRDETDSAVASLRRALFIDPGFGLAAFALGRAHDAAGRDDAGRSAYARALRTLQSSAERHAAILGQVELADVAAACRARIQGGT